MGRLICRILKDVVCSVREDYIPKGRSITWVPVSSLVLQYWPLALPISLWSQFIFSFGKSSNITCLGFSSSLSVSYKTQVCFGRHGGFFFPPFCLNWIIFSSSLWFSRAPTLLSLCFAIASGFSLVLLSRCKSLSSSFSFFAVFVFVLVPLLYQGLFPRCLVFYIRVVFRNVHHMFYAFYLPFSSSFNLGGFEPLLVIEVLSLFQWPD